MVFIFVNILKMVYHMEEMCFMLKIQSNGLWLSVRIMISVL